MSSGRTTRLVLEALGHLSGGFDVVIVAHPATEAFRIVDLIHDHARTVYQIPCELNDAHYAAMRDHRSLLDAEHRSPRNSDNLNSGA